MNTPKRFKRETSLLEYLPNEIFLEIFEYLNGVDVIYAFFQLNNRLDDIVNTYVDKFDFKSVSRAKFTYVTHQHDIRRWRLLRLSDDDHTPGQIKYFAQLFPLTQYISQLECLSVLNMKPDYAEEFLLQIRSLNNLVSLSIGQVCGLNIQSIELPSLKRLSLNSCKHTNWIQHFHALESLQHTIEYNCNHNYNWILPNKLKYLKVIYFEEEDGNSLRKILEDMSQLTKLALYDKGEYGTILNGRIWEELIKSSLPLLKIFQFFFSWQQYSFNANTSNEILASFSTPFYLIEKRWFVRFDHSSKHPYGGTLYTLPFAFSSMKINTYSFDLSESTLPLNDFNQIRTNYYSRINTVVLNNSITEQHTGLLPCNFIHLILNTSIPLNWIHLLTNVRDLHFGRNENISSANFLPLLEHTPNLQSLTIHIFTLKQATDEFTNENVCQLLSRRIKSLTIPNTLYSFDRNTVSVRALNSLVRIFSMHCQHLTITLGAHPNTVYPILRRMRQLRSLHIKWNFRRNCSDAPTPIPRWLGEQLTDPSAVNYINSSIENHLFIWFGHRT